MHAKPNWLQTISQFYQEASQQRLVALGLCLLSFPFQLLVLVRYLLKNRLSELRAVEQKIKRTIEESGAAAVLKEKLLNQEKRKADFLQQNSSKAQMEKRANELYQAAYQKELKERTLAYYQETTSEQPSFLNETVKWLQQPFGFVLSLFLGLPMYVLLLIVSIPTLRYIINRLVMMVFVIIGVTIIVFTLLYLSPSDSATNILGVQATPDQIVNFNAVHGLDDPYLIQLGRTIKGIFTFDLGNAFEGNERVVTMIMRRFPVTLQLTLFALALSVMIALPAGIYAAVKANTTFDHLFMLIALIGISIPSFWQGLIFILTFSINLGWLPATYNADNLVSLMMPAVVLGTGLMASVARMTRSSTLEVINEDYILTARAKGLSTRRVILRHAVPNALIPIVTIIGLQFGGMLGGSSVTEKVFNINGVGSYIVDKQFVPDIPSVMGGVIYIAVILSLVNVFIDLLYSFIDPRIRSRIKSGR